MSASTDHAVAGVSRRRIVVASLVGTSIEFYDFYLYGTAAALVFGRLFFPSASATAGTLAAFATFAAGFVARPVGALLLGHWGDRVGRKRMLVLSLLLMGLSTVAIGLVPAYAAIGVAAPALLVACRVLQGIGLGGEWGGAVLLATEYAPEGRRGLWSAYPQLGPAVGFVAANGLFLVLDGLLGEDAFDAWGWRIPFLLSGVLVAVGYVVRTSIAETPVFTDAMAEVEDRPSVPVLELLRRQWWVLVLSTVSFVLAFTLFYTVTTFALSYGTETLDLPKRPLLLCTLVAAVVMGVATPLLASWSDRVGRRRVCLGAAIGAVVWAYPMFWLIDTGSYPAICLAMSVGLVVFAAIYAPMGAYLPELFATRYRYTGAGIAYSAAGIVGGGVTPLLATAWVSGAGSSWPVSAYVLVVGAVSVVCLLLLTETKDRGLR
ncbi:MFS transporter [Marmoricola endophyticus]|uniref:MFS transporter n=1 Tax=Marmoricola endophyticus TaxID=2040280 RepID=UPI00166E0E98|nr:MFS transporter [Marmoricola endophyticus]